MTDGWFADAEAGDDDAASAAIREGSADEPRDWPALAVQGGYADDEDEYYDRLHQAALATARIEVRERERADDQQLIHAVRAMDDCQRTANELAERVAEWAGSRSAEVTGEDPGGIEVARSVVEHARSRSDGDPEGPGGEHLVALAERVAALADEADALRSFVERTAPAVAPNLSALAGPVLAARLIALAGGLEAIAKLPSGTVQVLGAEDALFAHLRGNAPSPKHGIIYTHEAVRGTHPENRGSAARALAGKLSIAARIDHYSGDLRPSLQDDLADRIETIQSRSTGGDHE